MQNEIIGDVIKVYSAHYYYNKYKGCADWFISDMYETFSRKLEWQTIAKDERVQTWQAVMALRRLFKERGKWDTKTNRPIAAVNMWDAWYD